MPASLGSQGLSDIFSVARSHTGFRAYKNGRLPSHVRLRHIKITSLKQFRVLSIELRGIILKSFLFPEKSSQTRMKWGILSSLKICL